MLVRVAKSMDDYKAVWRLTYEEYTKCGYTDQSKVQDSCLQHYPHLDQIPETSVILVEECGKLLGTISVTEDGRFGLHTDEAFSEQTERIRDECAERGESLGASWRIVTSSAARQQLSVVKRLISSAIVNMRERGLDVLLFTFHPKHERFYQKVLGLRTLAKVSAVGSVCENPAVLMIGQVVGIATRWEGAK